MTRNELDAIKAAIMALKNAKRGARMIASHILEGYDELPEIVKAGLKVAHLDTLFEQLRELTE